MTLKLLEQGILKWPKQNGFKITGVVAVFPLALAGLGFDAAQNLGVPSGACLINILILSVLIQYFQFTF